MRPAVLRFFLIFVLGSLGFWPGWLWSAPLAASISLTSDQVGPEQVAIVINEVDPQSVAVGKYYKRARGIPDENVIYVSFFAEGANIPAQEFAPIRRVIGANTLPRIRAYAITWTTPYRVDCMSLTSAITLGLDQRLCAADCSATLESPYYGTRGQMDHSALRKAGGLPPSMMLAGASEKQVFELIDRGVRSDYSQPKTANAFLLKTSDARRSVRAAAYEGDFRHFNDERVSTHFVASDYLTNQTEIMFYFTGSKTVRYLGKNRFLPGAAADHLTSAGGMLTDSFQMSVLRWLEAGATGSYGTVVEPCNHTGKFPNPIILMRRRLSGASLIDAYWSSVKMPGQGVFVGEPMSAPYASPANRR
ncbi:MAG: TIGR03790 family protein [Pseudomonadota bacterium]|nr:TIGR03790 family protein [Pseudomonadota bacterium]